MEDFLTGLVALEDGHGAAGKGEGVGEEFAELVVGTALERGGVDFDLQRITEPADDRAARGVGDGFDWEGAGSGRHRILSRRFFEERREPLVGDPTWNRFPIL